MNHLQDKKVGVVILTFNRLSLLKITIKKVVDSFQPFEILIVDNNSNDGTREHLRLWNILFHFLRRKFRSRRRFSLWKKIFWREKKR